MNYSLASRQQCSQSTDDRTEPQRSSTFPKFTWLKGKGQDGSLDLSAFKHQRSRRDVTTSPGCHRAQWRQPRGTAHGAPPRASAKADPQALQAAKPTVSLAAERTSPMVTR